MNNHFKNMPKRRFPEFENTGEWIRKSLSEVAENLDNRRIPITGTNRTKGDIPYYGASGIIDYVSDFIFEEDLLCVSEDGANLVARIYPIAFPIFGKTWVNNHAHVLKFGNKAIQIIVENYLNSISLDDYLTGMAQPKLNKTMLDIIPIALPKSEAEQQKIAACLSSLDAWIAAQTEAVATLQLHKKGLLQQLFPAAGETVPRLRFSEFEEDGEWENNVLDKIAYFVKEKVSIEKLQLATYVSTENLLPHYAGVIIASKLPPSGSFTRFKKEDVLISNIRPYLKKVWTATGEGAASNDVIVLRAGLWVTPSFLSYILKNDAFIDYVMESAKGVKMPRGDKALMEEYPVMFPKNKTEQQQIAACLGALDERIAAETEQLTALKAHKKGLLQQLFPSAGA